MLGLDFETTGTTPGVASVVEVGLVLWETALHAPVRMTGYLVDPGFNAVWEPGVEEYNGGLTKELCAKYGTVEDTALRTLLSYLTKAEAVVAHNGLVFDRLFLKHWAEKYGMDWQPEKLWIDTMVDLGIKGIKLSHMAADHKILNPFPHRAVYDVSTMLQMLDQYDLNKVLTTAKSPSLTVQAIVSFAENQKAKTRGFYPRYENGKFQAWLKTIKECQLEEETAACTALEFEIKIVKK